MLSWFRVTSIGGRTMFDEDWDYRAFAQEECYENDTASKLMSMQLNREWDEDESDNDEWLN